MVDLFPNRAARCRIVVGAYRFSYSFLLLTVLALCFGCGGQPPLHSITGKVSLGGKTYPRLIVYFYPKSGRVGSHNLGVGETDAAGNLTLRSTAGDGLAAGEYKVFFSCMVTPSGSVIDAGNEKFDDRRGVETVELVPDEYASDETTPVIFQVRRQSENNFEFDIPVSR